MDLRAVGLFIAAVLFATIKGQDSSAVSTNNKFYCGQHLAETLSAVCKGNYNTLNKASDIYGNGFWSSQYATDVQKDAQFPFRSKAAATTLMTNFRRRRRRGVFNECCEKPCTHAELSTYCGGRRK